MEKVELVGLDDMHPELRLLHLTEAILGTLDGPVARQLQRAVSTAHELPVSQGAEKARALTIARTHLETAAMWIARAGR